MTTSVFCSFRFRAGRFLAPLFLLLACTLQAEEGGHDWSKTPELFPGIKHVFLDTKKPRPLKINVLRVDLGRKDLRFMTVKKDPDWVMYMQFILQNCKNLLLILIITRFVICQKIKVTKRAIIF